jgi:hypothetical protein
MTVHPDTLLWLEKLGLTALCPREQANVAIDLLDLALDRYDEDDPPGLWHLWRITELLRRLHGEVAARGLHRRLPW